MALGLSTVLQLQHIPCAVLHPGVAFPVAVRVRAHINLGMKERIVCLQWYTAWALPASAVPLGVCILSMFWSGTSLLPFLYSLDFLSPQTPAGNTHTGQTPR